MPEYISRPAHPVGELEEARVRDLIEVYARVLVFCGPRHRRLKIDSLPNGTLCRLEIIRIPAM